MGPFSDEKPSRAMHHSCVVNAVTGQGAAVGMARCIAARAWIRILDSRSRLSGPKPYFGGAIAPDPEGHGSMRVRTGILDGSVSTVSGQRAVNISRDRPGGEGRGRVVRARRLLPCA